MTSPLTPRLLAVAWLVPRGSRVADVGAEHGLLATWLLEGGRASHAIATDRQPLLPTVTSLSGFERRTGDGLSVLDRADGIDVLILTGLGGPRIVRILSDRALAGLGVSRLVLQPQNRVAFVRGWLVEHGYRIADERLPVDRGRSYDVIAAEPGEANLGHPALSREEVLEAGPVLLRTRPEAARNLWRRRVALLERVVPRTSPGPSRDAVLARLGRARRILVVFEE